MARQAVLGALAETIGLPWPEEAPPDPETRFDAEQARLLLDITLAQLAARGLIAFATGGTLLGLVREGRLLPFDKDLDVVTPIPSFARVCHTLLELGWQESWVPIHAVNYRCFRHREQGITLDIIGSDFDAERHRVVGGWWLAGLPREAGRLLHFSEFRLKQTQGAHGPYWAVQQPEQLLAELYGPGWRIPDPDFDSILGTPALVAHNDFTRTWGCLRLLEAWLHGRRRRFERLLHPLAQLDPDNPALGAARRMAAALTPC